MRLTAARLRRLIAAGRDDEAILAIVEAVASGADLLATLSVLSGAEADRLRTRLEDAVGRVLA